MAIVVFGAYAVVYFAITFMLGVGEAAGLLERLRSPRGLGVHGGRS